MTLTGTRYQPARAKHFNKLFKHIQHSKSLYYIIEFMVISCCSCLAAVLHRDDDRHWPKVAPSPNTIHDSANLAMSADSRAQLLVAQDPAPAPPAPSGYVHYCGSGCACQISAVFPVNIQTCATNCEGAAGFMHYLIDCRCCASPLVTGDPD